MSCIDEKLKPLEGYLLSITRNIQKGWFEFEVGVPSEWVYKGNEIIDCNVIDKSEVGHLLKIVPKHDNITVDDLIDFLQLIIDTNSQIQKKEKEFNDKMDKVKKDLENQAKKFYEELNNLREESFKKFNIKNSQISNTSSNKMVDNSKSTQSKKRGRPPKKNKDE